MFYVYLLISETHPQQHYIGLTGDLKKRLAGHNHQRSKHTSKFAPWNLAAYFAFAQRETAVAFVFLFRIRAKSWRDAAFAWSAAKREGSALAFARRHFGLKVY